MSAAAITQELQGAKAQDVVVVLNDKVSVTPEQLSKIMSVNKDWPYEGRADVSCSLRQGDGRACGKQACVAVRPTTPRQTDVHDKSA